MNITVVIPTYNAVVKIKEILDKIFSENKDAEVIVIDSSSSDDTVKVAGNYGARIIVIPKDEFNHGKTRNIALKEAKGDIVIFFTQDVMPRTEAVNKLMKAFNDQQVAIAFGRQLPHKDANVFSSHARFFNYHSYSKIMSLKDKEEYGIKTVFNSNSFAAYRKNLLMQINGFPESTILSEDMYAAAKLVIKGYKIAYVAEACVYHSHNYSMFQEFKRYFDIGVFQNKERWIIETFGKAENEGMKFLISEIRYLIRSGFWYLLPLSLIRNILKYVGFKLGYNEKLLPKSLKRILSMNKLYWEEK